MNPLRQQLRQGISTHWLFTDHRARISAAWEDLANSNQPRRWRANSQDGGCPCRGRKKRGRSEL